MTTQREIRLSKVGDQLVQSFATHLGDGEELRLVGKPMMWYDAAGSRRMLQGLAVTSQRLLVLKGGLFGSKLVSWPILEIPQYHVDLFMGGGPDWEYGAHTTRGVLKFVYDLETDAHQTAGQVNLSYLLLRDA